MNTKGIKFLAVLAVMAMAFAAVVVLAPADNDNDAIVVYGNGEVYTGVTEIGDGTKVTGGVIYVAEDATIKVKGALANPVTILVQNGVEVSVDCKVDPEKEITIMTVTGDQQALVYMDQTTSTSNEGKIKLNGELVYVNTAFTFIGERGQSVFYQAAIVYLDFDYTTSGIHVSDNGKNFYGLTNAYIGADKTFTNVPSTVGANVTIASGQTIDVVGQVTLGSVNYGAAVYTDGVTTFYGVGDEIGTIELGSGDEAKVRYATATLTNGTNAIKMTNVKGPNSGGIFTGEVTVTAGSNKFDVSGAMSSGTVNVSGVVNFSGSPTDIQGGTVTIANKAVVSGAIKVGGKLIIKTDAESMGTTAITGTGTVVAQNAGLWNANHDAITCVDGFSGLVDTYAISKVAELKDDISTSRIAPDQTIKLVGDTTIYKSLTIDGILIVDAGVTLTVDEAQLIINAPQSGPHYTQVINNGTIIIKAKAVETSNATTVTPGVKFLGGYIENNGKVEFAAKNDCTSTESVINGVYKFVNNGSLKVSAKDAITLGGKVDNKGTIEINGVLANDTDFTNNGIVTLGSNATVKDVAIKLGSGSVFNINAVKISGTNTIKVYNAKSEIIIGATGLATDEFATIRNLSFTGYKSLLGYEAIDAKGNMTVSIPNNTSNEKFATVQIGGNVIVSDSLSIPNHVKLTFVQKNDKDVEFTVAGTFTIADTVVPAGDNVLDIYVTGVITTTKDDLLSGADYNGAKYSLADGTTVYTTIENAVAAAYLSDIMSVIVGDLGSVVIYEDLTIPSQMSVDSVSGNSVIEIGDEYTATVVKIDETGKINMPIVVVNGALYAEDSSDVYDDDVTAHVKIAGENDVTYASLNYAIDNKLGSVLVLMSDFVMDGSSLIIPEGVVIDAINKNVAFVCIDSNLYVYGTLVVNEFYFVAETNDDLELVVKGTIMEETTGAYIDNKWFTPEGVSYYDTILYDDEEKVFFVITDISNLQNAIDNADDAKVTIEGSPELGDISVRGPAGEVATITFSEDINAGTITMDDVIIKASDGAKISATFANDRGKIVILGAYVVEDKVFSIYSVDDGVVTMSGPITDITDASYFIGFYGETGMENGVIGWGEYIAIDTPAVYPTIVFNGDTTVTGKKNAIMNTTDDSWIDYGTVSVLGGLYADNAAKIEIDADIDVLGALAAAEKEQSKAAGVIAVGGNIFVGTTQAAIWDPALVEKATNGDRAPEYFGGPSVELNAAAVLSGKIDLSEFTRIVVAAGAMVDDEIVEDLDSFYITIDDELWLTIFGNGSFYLDGLVIPVVNCDIEDVYDQDYNTVSKFSNEYRVLYDSQAINFGVTNWINIGVNYDVFTVIIKTDGSVKAVYIDGILMYTGENRNTFELARVATGTHKVTVEAATGYDADKCVLYTELGTILPGMAFTFTEYDCEIIEGINTHTVVYNINGTEIQPEPVPPTPEEESQWTITTILLVILVVLIAIMAVIVALRLNRS
jgi:hypothetical protein